MQLRYAVLLLRLNCRVVSLRVVSCGVCFKVGTLETKYKIITKMLLKLLLMVSFSPSLAELAISDPIFLTMATVFFTVLLRKSRNGLRW